MVHLGTGQGLKYVTVRRNSVQSMQRPPVQPVSSPKHAVCGISEPLWLSCNACSLFRFGSEDWPDEVSEDFCKCTNKCARDSLYGIELAAIAREYLKRKYKMDTDFEFCVSVMQVSKCKNDSCCVLHVAVRSDVDKSC